MPIYAYRCESCGFAKDVLQKISDPLLTDCPSCGAASFQKQVTAAGFQLKGSGWYVTDFRDGKNTKTSGDAASTPAADAKSAPDAVATPAANPDAAPASAAASSTSPAAPAAGTAASSAP
jgi:putative FmdB family regulatory protein